MKEISVFGGGSWATAIVKILTENKLKVNWYVRNIHQVDQINNTGINPRYLSYLKLNKDYIRASTDFEQVLQASPLLIFLIPSSQLESLMEQVDIEIPKDRFILTSIKGTVGAKQELPSAYIANKFSIPTDRIGIIAGPCHAEEVAKGRRTYMTLASKNLHMMERLKPLFSTGYISVNISQDLLGIEYAAIYKNVVGVVSGMAKGLNYGDNFLAVLIANAIAELETLMDALGMKDTKVSNSSYLGDLLVTGYSNHSRNRNLGELLGQGLSLEQAISAMSMVAEGVSATMGLFQLASKLNINLPILNTAYRVIYKHMPVETEFKLLERNLV